MSVEVDMTYYALEPRVDRADHDSLFARFEQLDALLEKASDQKATFLDVWRAARDARQLAQFIRRQVLK
jgi:hypothetical protein